MHCEILHFKGPGFIIADVPNDVRRAILDEIDDIKLGQSENKKFNSQLAGFIEQEYELTNCRPAVEQMVLPLTKVYDHEFDFLSSFNFLNRDLPIGLGKLWVNLQRKYECNPPHMHSGIFSFVIWVKIPYNLSEERARFPDQNPKTKASATNFYFQYANSLGGLSEYSIEPEEWKMAFFPAKLSHGVLPFFTSDEYRISVSGNLQLNA